MARLTFGRTVIKTKMEVTFVTEDNKIKSTTITLFGGYNMQTAQVAARKALKAKGATVTKISHESYYGRMSLEDFDKVCTDKSNYKEW